MSAGGVEGAEALRDRYRKVSGTLPRGIELAEATGRIRAVEEIESLRKVLLAGTPLEPRVQQLVHFAQLVALGREGPARLHAAARPGQGLASRTWPGSQRPLSSPPACRRTRSR